MKIGALQLMLVVVLLGISFQAGEARSLKISSVEENPTVDTDGPIATIADSRELKRRKRKRKTKEPSGIPPGGKNIAMCYNIMETWWKDREEQKEGYEAVVKMDEHCANYDGDRKACQFRNERSEYSHLSQAARDAFCVMVGAGSDKCVANACNQLNNGNCTLQNTAGTCVWYSEEEVTAINTYFANIGSPERIKGVGCYRNRCNQPGTGRIGMRACQANSIPGVFDCYYCQVDKYTKRKGIGCQMTQSATTAGCAPVNQKDYPKETIWVDSKNPDCQCSDMFPICYNQVHGRGSNGNYYNRG